MVKVKMAEVTHNQKDFNQKAIQVQDGLTAVSKSMIAVPKTPGFSGEAKRSMASYTDRIHKSTNQDLINNISELKSQYQKTIQMFKGEVDSSEDAILDSNYIQEISGRVKQQRSPLEEALNTCNKGVSQAAGIVAVTHLNHEAVQNLEQTCRSAKQTVSKLEQFNQNKPSVAMENLSKQTVNVNSVLTEIERQVYQETKKLLNKIVDGLKSVVNNDWYQRFKMLISSDPKRALKEILESKKLVAMIQKSPKIMGFIASALVIGTIKMGSLPPKVMQAMKKLAHVRSIVNFANKYIPNVLSNNFWHIGRSFIKDWKIVNKLPISKLGKGKLFGLDTIINIGVDWADDKQHNLGHAVSDGVIDSITSVGPVSGAMAGAVGGPWGASAGFVVGSINQIYKFFHPKASANAKTFAHQVEDKINPKIGKAVRDIKWENIYPVPYYPNYYPNLN